MEKEIKEMLESVRTGERTVGETTNKLVDMLSQEPENSLMIKVWYVIAIVALGIIIGIITWSKSGFETGVFSIVVLILAAIVARIDIIED